MELLIPAKAGDGYKIIPTFPPRGLAADKAFTVLLISDELGAAKLLSAALKQQGTCGVRVVHVPGIEAGQKTLDVHACDVVLLDLPLPVGDSLELVRQATAVAPRLALVVLTEIDDESLALQALQAGAQDYLVKGQTGIHVLLRTLRYAMERKACEEVLFREKQRAETTLNCIGEGVICTDASGNITFLNAFAASMTGWSSGRLGRTIA